MQNAAKELDETEKEYRSVINEFNNFIEKYQKEMVTLSQT